MLHNVTFGSLSGNVI